MDSKETDIENDIAFAVEKSKYRELIKYLISCGADLRAAINIQRRLPFVDPRPIEDVMVEALINPWRKLPTHVGTITLSTDRLKQIRAVLLPDGPPFEEPEGSDVDMPCEIPPEVADFMAFSLLSRPRSGRGAARVRTLMDKPLAPNPVFGAPLADDLLRHEWERSETRELTDALMQHGARPLRLRDLPPEIWAFLDESLVTWLKRPWIPLNFHGSGSVEIPYNILKILRQHLLPGVTFTESPDDLRGISFYELPQELADYMVLKLIRQPGAKGAGPAQAAAAAASAASSEESGASPAQADSSGAADASAEELNLILRRVSEAGQLVLENKHPSQAVLDDFGAAVNELLTYIKSQEQNTVTKIHGDLSPVNSVLGYIKTPASVVSGILKGSSLYTDSGTSARLGDWSTGFSGAGTVLGGLNTIYSFITLVKSVSEISKTNAWNLVRIKKIMAASRDFSASLTGVYNTTRGIASLSGAAWSGTSAAIQAGGFAGASLSAISLGVSVFHMASAQKDMEQIGSYQSRFKRFRPDDQASPQHRKELEAKKKTLTEITEISRRSAERRATTAGMQAISSALQMTSALVALGGPVTAIFSAGLSLTAFVIGISGVVKDYRMKKAEKRDVIDNYIGMDSMYARFKHDHQKLMSDEDFFKEYGSEKEIRAMLRNDAEASLGFPNDDKMHASIMWSYAQALFRGAFQDDNGEFLTDDDWDKLSDSEKKERDLFTDLLLSYGFKVIYPKDRSSAPSPGMNEIYKKLMA